MKKSRYQLYVDGEHADSSNSVRIVKKAGDMHLDEIGGYHAEIRTGNRVYAYRWYNSEWHKCI